MHVAFCKKIYTINTGLYELIVMAIASRKPRTTAVYCNQWARIHITEIIRRYAEIEKIHLRAGDVTGTKDLEGQVVIIQRDT